MSNNEFDPCTGIRHLTPQQWTALRKCIVERAHAERRRAIRRTLAGIWRLIRSGWHHIQVRQEARATLRSMTDRELWDIGVSRSGIEAAIRRHETDAVVEILHPDIQAVIPPKRDIHCEAES